MMAHWKKVPSVTVSLLVLVAILAAGCGEPPADCDASQFITWDGQTYSEQRSSADPGQCDPRLVYGDTTIVTGAAMHSFTVSADWGHTGGVLYDDGFVLTVSSATTSVATGTYPLLVGLDVGQATLTVNEDSIGRTCHAAAGTVTYDSFGPVGSPVSGSYSVAAWDTTVSSLNCPALPATGTFNLIRD